jgi:hypothetical protein
MYQIAQHQSSNFTFFLLSDSKSPLIVPKKLMVPGTALKYLLAHQKASAI